MGCGAAGKGKAKAPAKNPGKVKKRDDSAPSSNDMSNFSTQMKKRETIGNLTKNEKLIYDVYSTLGKLT